MTALRMATRGLAVLLITVGVALIHAEVARAQQPTTIILVLTPPTDTNTVGRSHMVTATVTDGGQPVQDATVSFTVSGAHSTTGSCSTGFNGQCTFTYLGERAGQDTIIGWIDFDSNGVNDPTEPQGGALKTWIVPNLALTPPTATNTAGRSHTVTATVTDENGQPMQVEVSFTVSGAHSTTGNCSTGANGQCTFTYLGERAGQDTIIAYIDLDNDGMNDGPPSESQAGALKTWLAPNLALTPPTATNTVGRSHTVTATVTDNVGQPMEAAVSFTVSGAHSTTGFCLTGANGQCTFTYLGVQPGQDTIVAYIDIDDDGMNDGPPSESQAGALKTWLPATPGCPENGGDDDGDDDGLEDRDELVFGTLLGITDSDDNGIRDGNDDSDDDGEDDEDEDDDTDGECPNDSDGDGEDDEDEDDDEDND